MVVIDSNIWIYLFSEQDKRKQAIVKEIIPSLSLKGIVISNQIFKEIGKVLSVDVKLPVEDTLNILSNIQKLTVIKPETPLDIRLAVEIRERFKFQFFDSIIVAFCLNNKIEFLITEDKFIDEIFYKNRKLTLINPFE
ncbi:MAG: hypothetical protein DSY59_04695 [Persephonella sp.]|nr:MAG: hypothetical protein DSY60_04875 [Persephonella sp.]RUM59318.1 MAG: hypothetical protein DSY59_04695 [Persephonella sp.]